MNNFIDSWSSLLLHSLWIAALFQFIFWLLDQLNITATSRRFMKISTLTVFLATLGAVFYGVNNNQPFYAPVLIDTINDLSVTRYLEGEIQQINSFPPLSYLVFWVWIGGIMMGILFTYFDWINLYRIRN